MTSEHRPTDPTVWRGRIDSEESGDATRWHQHVKPWVPGCARGVALVGFACDAGVRRNQGRAGAAGGPAAIRQALANLAWHQAGDVWDAGDVIVDGAGDDLEGGQRMLARLVGELLGDGHRVLALGGGHEIAYASFLGLEGHLASTGGSIGVVNVDTHFDLRAGARATSGTPFRQIAERFADGRSFRYLCLGIDESANTRALFDTAQRLGVEWRRDVDMGSGRYDDTLAQLTSFVRRVDRVHLSIDLDVLPSATAPGVSAPAARGVPLELVELIVGEVVATGKLAIADIAECNPALDVDGRTARVAARLVVHLSR